MACRSIASPAASSPRTASTRPRLCWITASTSVSPMRCVSASASRSTDSARSHTPSSATMNPMFARTVETLRTSPACSKLCSAASSASRQAAWSPLADARTARAWCTSASVSGSAAGSWPHSSLTRANSRSASA